MFGASLLDITKLLSGRFVILVVIANLIALPLAWWATGQWLQQFAYRTDIPLALFLAAAGLTLFLALLSAGSQVLRAARTNPAEVLQKE